MAMSTFTRICALFLLAALALNARAPAGAQSPEPAAGAEPIVVAQGGKVSSANQFNRLLKQPMGQDNPPPWKDGIHDPANPGTELLQPPAKAFADLPDAATGNNVDWVKALREGSIQPWYDFTDPEAEPFVMDLNIVREVRGSMPNVVYPHLAHTEWLDCTNCHDAIFVPQKGANQMSMAGILLGQKCGVCHGKVAFPVTNCRRCHSQPKTAEELRKLAEDSEWAK